MIIGFLGTGGITEGIVTGLYNCGDWAQPVLISKRSESRSQKLARLLPKVEVVDDNQSIVDRSDWVVVSVLPEQALPLLSTLRFRDDQYVISLAAGIEHKTLAAHVHPVTRVCRAIPMPPIELGLGPTPVYPPQPEVEALFDRIGNAVAVEDESQFTALAASSAVMATFFAWVASNASWLEKKGVPPRESALYASSVFHALANMTTRVDAAGLQRMSLDCLTPGGLNEQVLKGARKAGLIEGLQAQIDAVMERLER